MKSLFPRPVSSSYLNFSQSNKQRILLIPKKDILKSSTQNIKALNEKISNILLSELDDNFHFILLKSESEFLTQISQNAMQFLKDIFNDSELSSQARESFKSNERMIKLKYTANYKALSSAWNEYQRTPQKFKTLKHFRKHCSFTDDIAVHSCDSIKSKFIEVVANQNEKQIANYICIKCLHCFSAKSILLYCTNCKCEYYSSILAPNEDVNILPATWDKYHCGNLVNETMKCVKCQNILYIDLNTRMLVCLNRRCNFTVKPKSITWKCAVCNTDFNSDAKVYNPKEIQVIKKAIKKTLLLRNKALPKEVPCCKEDPKTLEFYHKKECKGILYQGSVNEKDIVVCELCHAMNFHERFIWTCPICKNRFRIDENKDGFVDWNGRNSSRGIIIDSNDNEKAFSSSACSDNTISKSIDMKRNRPHSHYASNANEFMHYNSISKQSSNQSSNDKSNAFSKSPIKKRGRYNTLFEILQERNPGNRLKLPKDRTKGRTELQGEGRNNDYKINCKANIQDDNKSSLKETLKKQRSIHNDLLYEPSTEPEDKDKGLEEFGKKDNEAKDNNKREHRVFLPKESGGIFNNIFTKKNNKEILVKRTCQFRGQSLDKKEIPKEKEKTKIKLLKDLISKERDNSISNGLRSPRFMKSKDMLKRVLLNSKIPLINSDVYKIKKTIGEGSYGKIYLTQDVKTKESFALKKIIINNPSEILNFQKEYELTYLNQDPHIMKIFGIQYKCLDISTYSIYVLMELANCDWNEEIKKHAEKKKKYQEKELMQILCQLVGALAFLQENRVSHRDIKPQNILIFNNNVYKIGDFGEAKEIKIPDDINTLRGTQLYMSPALYIGLKMRKKDILHNVYKSDVYSLGYCLLYAATLNYKTINQIRDLTEMKEITRIIKKSLQANYSETFISIVLKMLEFDEAKRVDFIELDNILENINIKK